MWRDGRGRGRRGRERGTRSQDARSKPEVQETGEAKMAGLYKEEKLGEEVQSSPLAGQFRLSGGACQLERLCDM